MDGGGDRIDRTGGDADPYVKRTACELARAGSLSGGFFAVVVGGTLGAVLGGLLFSTAADRGVAGLDLTNVTFLDPALLLTLLRLAGGDATVAPQPKRP
jgi:hypothetical protein